MKANWKSRNYANDKALVQMIQREAQKQANDIAYRAQLEWMLAMRYAGLSVRTIDRIIKKQLPRAVEEYKAAGHSDKALIDKLAELGVTGLKMPGSEL